MKRILFLLLLICLTVNTAIADFLLPDNLDSIGVEAFYGDTSLDVVTIPGTVRSIGSKAFSNSSVKEVHVNGNVSIADDAFTNTNPKFFTSKNTTVFTWALSHRFVVRCNNTEYLEGQNQNGWFVQETQYDATTGEEIAYQCIVYTDSQKTNVVSTTTRTYSSNDFTDNTVYTDGKIENTTFYSDGSMLYTGEWIDVRKQRLITYSELVDSNHDVIHAEKITYTDTTKTTIFKKTITDPLIGYPHGSYADTQYDGNGNQTGYGTTIFKPDGTVESTGYGYNGDEKPSSYEYHYDSNGNYTYYEFVIYDDGQRNVVSTRTVRDYNVSGALYIEHVYDGSGMEISTTRYNTDGSRERTWKGVNGDGDPCTRTDRYDSNGKLTYSEFIIYQAPGRTAVKSRRETVYYADGSSLDSEFWDDGSVYYRQDSRYDQNGNIVGNVIRYVYSDPGYKNLINQYMNP